LTYRKGSGLDFIVCQVYMQRRLRRAVIEEESMRLGFKVLCGFFVGFRGQESLSIPREVDVLECA
jgi:hypothetical protein